MPEKCEHNVFNFVVSAEPADGLAPLGVRISELTVLGHLHGQGWLFVSSVYKRDRHMKN